MLTPVAIAAVLVGVAGGFDGPIAPGPSLSFGTFGDGPCPHCGGYVLVLDLQCHCR
ncbi:MAG: hypothetical protein AB7O97_19595 [Planctomycetota bacterium]